MSQTSFTAPESPFRRLNLKAKVLLSIPLLISLLAIHSAPAMIPLAMVVLVMSVMARLKFGDAWRLMKSLALLLVLTPVLHILFATASAKGNNIAGLVSGLMFSVKILLMGFVALAMTRSTHPSEIPSALVSRGAARSRFAKYLRKFAFSLGLAIQLFPMISSEAARIKTAQQARGLTVRRGLLGGLSLIKPLAVPVLAAVLYRSNAITVALIARGFSLTSARTNYQPGKLSALDIWYLSLVTTGLLTAWWLTV